MTRPLVRVFLCTYRRNNLLPRALKSLRDQTFTHWVCELHNDAPDDPFPAELAAEIADPRITVVNHPRNLGGVGTFNLMFDACSEKYISLLEDDNWWQPDFLEVMVRTMEANPAVAVGWSNMRFWREEPDGTWTDVQKNVWERPQDAQVELFEWPQVRQTDTALHSTGALLMRTGKLDSFKVPLETDFEFVDTVRERAFPHPLLFVPQPLVNFALTLQTARNQSHAGRAEHNVLLTASFFKHVRPDDQFIQEMWRRSRRAPQRATNDLMFPALCDRHCRRLLRQASVSDWVFFLLSVVKRPALFVRAFRARSLYPRLWDYLDRHTRARCAQPPGT